MGSNQSKPAGDEKGNGKKKGKQPSNEKAPPTVVVDEGITNTDGVQFVPMTPLTPITPSNTLTAGCPTASAPPQVHVNIHELEGHSNVSRPPPPRRVRHLSELIDPNDLPRDFHTRSPSGNILGADEFAAHPDRPKSLRERREEVLKRVRAMSQGAENAESAGSGAGGSGVPPVPTVSAAAPGVENVKPTMEGGPTMKDVKLVKEDKKKEAKQAAKEKKIRAAAREKKAKAAAKDRKAKAAAREMKRKAARKQKMKMLKADRKKKEKVRASARQEKEAKIKGEMKARKKEAAKKQPWWKRCFCC